MQKFTRRGIASFGVAALLVLAPITATAAYADDEVVVAEAPVEVVEAPVEAVEAPVEAVAAEEPVEAVVPDELIVQQSSTEIELANTGNETVPASSELVSAAPVAARAAALAPTYGPGHGQSPIWVSVSGSVITATWSPTDYGVESGYTYWAYDIYNGTGYAAQGHTFETTFTATLVEGRTYEVFFHDGSNYGDVHFTFTPVAVPAPNAPTNVAATRLPLANGFSLAWAAPVDNAENPVTSYSIAVTTGESTSTVTTSDLSYDFTELPIGVNSTFAVTAVAADGQVSDAATTDATLEAIAPTVSQSLVLTRSGDTLSGTWVAPAYNGGSSVESYFVELLGDGDVVEDADVTAGAAITFKWDADFSVKYSFRVTATTKAGHESPVGVSNTVERPDFAPSAPTASATTNAYKNPMVNVYWEFVNQEGSEIESVTVTLYDESGAIVQRETHTVLDGRSNVPFYNLANDTTYSATVVATNAAGPSAESALVEIRTNGLVPPALTAEEVALFGNFSNVSAALTGTELVAHIDGLAAGAWVFGYAYSTPSALGWTQVDAAGYARWSIAGAGLAIGATHTLAVQNSFGEPLGSATFAIAAPAVVKAALAHTGTDSFSWIAIALAMLVVGAISTATKARRKARA